MIQRTIRGPPNAQTGSTSNQLTPKAPYKPALAKAGECQLDLFADRTSAKTMRANQLRLWFASMAYVLVCALRRVALQHTQFARASCGTIRLKLLKIGALVRTSVRRIKLAMPSAFPYQAEYRAAHAALAAIGN
jgi:hypothetical protein